MTIFGVSAEYEDTIVRVISGNYLPENDFCDLIS